LGEFHGLKPYRLAYNDEVILMASDDLFIQIFLHSRKVNGVTLSKTWVQVH